VDRRGSNEKQAHSSELDRFEQRDVDEMTTAASPKRMEKR
jgi:hypothetical protein